MSPKSKLTVAQAAKYLHVSQSKLKAMRRDGVGPVWFKSGEAVNSPVLYELDDLDRYVRSCKEKA